MKKIIFIDVDGTLVNYENELPNSAVQAIKKARGNKHKVYICTGRSKAEIYDDILDIGLDGMIGGNGSYVEHQGQVIMHQLITKEQCEHIVNWLTSRNLDFYLESNNGLFASPNFLEGSKQAIQQYSRKKGIQDVKDIDAKTAMPTMIYDGNLIRDDVNKVSFVLKSYQDHLDSIQAFPDLKPGTWGGAGETALFGDLGVKDVTKSHAIDVLLKYLNEDIENTIAIGDAKVDIPMLEYCNIGIAVNSGGKEIKEMADYITDDVDNDGLYKAFVHFGLIDDFLHLC